MSSIVGTRVIQDVDDEVAAVELRIVTQDDEWLGSFDRVEVWRSNMSPAGPFQAVTGPEWRPAILPANALAEPSIPVVGRSLILQNKRLLLLVDGRHEVSVVFGTAGMYTLQAAAQEITSKSSGLLRAYVDSDGKLVLVCTYPGTISSLEIVGGDAAPLLGLPTTRPESIAYGLDAHLLLVEGKQQYTFVDVRGSRKHYYRTRFLNSQTLVVGEFSDPFGADQAIGVNPVNVVTGHVDIVGGDGRPFSGLLVQVHAALQTDLVDGKLVTGSSQSMLTDEHGHAEFLLVRGVRYTVSVAATNLVREFVAPTDPSIGKFSMFDPSVGTQNDLFKVARPDLVYAERRTF